MQKSKVGITKVQNNGGIGEIISDLGYGKILVRFDNGIEKECSYSDFNRGLVSNKTVRKCYIGMLVYQRCNEYVELLELLPKGICRVRFEDGSTRIVRRSHFLDGDISSKTEQINSNTFNIGANFKNDLGQAYTIVGKIRDKNNSNLEVRFEDFSSCSMSHSKLSKNSKTVYPDYIRYTNSRKRLLNGYSVLECYFDTKIKQYIYVLSDKNGKRTIWHR